MWKSYLCSSPIWDYWCSKVCSLDVKHVIIIITRKALIVCNLFTQWWHIYNEFLILKHVLKSICRYILYTCMYHILRHYCNLSNYFKMNKTNKCSWGLFKLKAKFHYSQTVILDNTKKLFCNIFHLQKSCRYEI